MNNISIPNTTPPSGSCLPRQRTIKSSNSLLCIVQLRLSNPRVVKILIPFPLNQKLLTTSDNPYLHYLLDLILFPRLNQKLRFPLNITNNTLKLGNMKNIMNPPVLRQLQPVGHWSHTRQNPKWTCPNRC
jgi:hypothetical protein